MCEWFSIQRAQVPPTYLKDNGQKLGVKAWTGTGGGGAHVLERHAIECGGTKRQHGGNHTHQRTGPTAAAGRRTLRPSSMVVAMRP
jgi:hypothetical protein